MNGNPYLYILLMAGVTYAVRVLPLTLIRRDITSPFLRSFLYYVPYVTLSVMTFPAILDATVHPAYGWIGFATAMILAWRGKGLLTVACFSSVAVLAASLMLG